ncbi:MAG: hypothetical protein ACI8ZM_005360 [Crocinitomix sp.]|jgi:hypothetical protein
MKVTLLLQFLMLFNYSGIAQSGYIGKKRYVEFKWNNGISTKRIYKIEDEVIKSRRKFYTDFNLNIGLVPSRRIEFNFGYGFSVLRPSLLYFRDSDTLQDITGEKDLIIDNNYRAFDDLQFAFHSIKFEFKYFIKGNIAPIGKYIGLGCFAGVGKINAGATINYGDYGEIITEKRHSKTYKPSGLQQFTFDQDNKVKATMITIIAGQNFTLKKRLILSTQIVYPFLFFYPNHAEWTATIITRENSASSTLSEIRPSLVNAMGKAVLNNNLLKLDIGVKYFF